MPKQVRHDGVWMKPEKSDSKNKKFISFIIAAVLLTAVFGAALILMGYLIKSQVSATVKAQAELKALQDKEKNLRQLEGEYQKNQEQANQIMALLPNKDNFLQFVNFIEGKAADNGVSAALKFPEAKTTATAAGSTSSAGTPGPAATPSGTSQVSPATTSTPASNSTQSAGASTQPTSATSPTSAQAAQPAAQKISFGLEVSGGWGSIKSFWQAVEQGPYFVVFKSFKLELPGSFDRDGTVKLEGELYVDQSFATKS